jgi:hypothetical protein
VPSTNVGRVSAGAVATTGVSSLGLTAFAVFRLTAEPGTPAASWAELAGLGAAAACVSSLWLVLDYRLRKLDAQTRGRALQAAAELQLGRLRLHRALMDKAAAQPQLAAAFRELIIANARYLSVEQNAEPLVSPHQHAPARTLGSAGRSSADTRRTAGRRRRRGPTIGHAPPLSPRGPS